MLRRLHGNHVQRHVLGVPESDGRADGHARADGYARADGLAGRRVRCLTRHFPRAWRGRGDCVRMRRARDDDLSGNLRADVIRSVDPPCT